MVSSPTSAPAAVLDASVVVGLCAREPGKFESARKKLQDYARGGWKIYAPGVLIAEVLFVLCRKLHEGHLTAPQHDRAVRSFVALLRRFSVFEAGDGSLFARATEIAAGYGCARSSDAIYLAMAEQLSLATQAEAATFDDGWRTQATAKSLPMAVDILQVI